MALTHDGYTRAIQYTSLPRLLVLVQGQGGETMKWPWKLVFLPHKIQDDNSNCFISNLLKLKLFIINIKLLRLLSAAANFGPFDEVILQCPKQGVANNCSLYIMYFLITMINDKCFAVLFVTKRVQLQFFNRTIL